MSTDNPPSGADCASCGTSNADCLTRMNADLGMLRCCHLCGIADTHAVAGPSSPVAVPAGHPDHLIEPADEPGPHLSVYDECLCECPRCMTKSGCICPPCKAESHDHDARPVAVPAETPRAKIEVPDSVAIDAFAYLRPARAYVAVKHADVGQFRAFGPGEHEEWMAIRASEVASDPSFRAAIDAALDRQDTAWAAALSLLQEETAAPELDDRFVAVTKTQLHEWQEIQRKFNYASVSKNYHQSVVDGHTAHIAAIRARVVRDCEGLPGSLVTDLMELTAEPDEDDN